tara:strand:+ start:2283 stop:3257 length:975 start_codon:yes stop_codon:yes gene_type:complete
MIIKSYEVNKPKLIDKFLLIYGVNEGLKNEVIENIILKNFQGDVLKYDESEVITEKENFILNLKSRSLFSQKKIIIINRVTDKFYSLAENIIEISLGDTQIILNSSILDKKSKIRKLFEIDKNLICIPAYEDNSRTLQLVAKNFLDKEKIKISQENINILIERAKGDRKNLKSELSKLKNFSLTRKNIQTEDIIKITNLAENYSVFELADNYLSKNTKKVSNILNENNFTNDDCILIIRTILNRLKRLLKLKIEQNKIMDLDSLISSYKPTIFWKEKEVVKKQINIWKKKDVSKMIYKINNLEILVKKNSNNSLNFVSDFVSNY